MTKRFTQAKHTLCKISVPNYREVELKKGHTWEMQAVEFD